MTYPILEEYYNQTISVVGNEKLDTKIEIRPKLDTIIRNLTDE